MSKTAAIGCSGSCAVSAIHGSSVNQPNETPEDSLLTEDEQNYVLTEDEQNYLIPE